MTDFADSTALAVDVELLTPAAAVRLSPALPAGKELLEPSQAGERQAGASLLTGEQADRHGAC